MKRLLTGLAFLIFLFSAALGACNYPIPTGAGSEEGSATITPGEIPLTQVQVTGLPGAAPLTSQTPEAEPAGLPKLNYAESLAVPESQRPEAASWQTGNGSLALMTSDGILVYPAGKQNKPEMIPAKRPVLIATSSQKDQIGWAAEDNSVHLWSAAQKKEIWNTPPAADAVTSLALSPNGNDLAYSSFGDKFYQVELSSGKVLTGKDAGYWLSDLAYSPDGKDLAGVDKQDFKVYFYKTGEPNSYKVLNWDGSASPALYGAYFSPGWKNLAWVARGTVQLMDVESGKLGKTLNHEDFISGVAWSPSGKSLAVISAISEGGSLAPGVVIWNVRDGVPVTRIVQDAPIRSISFSPAGDHLVMVLENGRVMIWNAVNIP